jgi:hypothetical protein
LISRKANSSVGEWSTDSILPPYCIGMILLRISGADNLQGLAS